MDTKLTLRLDKNVIEKAKKYATRQQQSLSRIVEAYLRSLTEIDQSEKEEVEISPFVKKISSGVQIPADLNHKNVYRDHIAKKHQ